MAYRKRAFVKRRRTRRSYKRTRYNRKRVSHIAFGGQPSSKLVKLRYCEEISLNAATGSITYNDFCANGMYDPNLTGTGHQPLGYDQLMAYYDHYTVIGSKITAQFVSTTGTNATPSYLAIGLYDTTAQPANYSSVEHMLESRRITMSPASTGAASYIKTNINEGRVVKYCSPKKFFNRSPKGDSTLKGGVTSNPSDLAVFSVIVGSVSGNDPSAVSLLITIDYIAIVSEPKLLSQS